MNKTEKRFRLYTMLILFVLLTVLLSVINGVNFTMAASDADQITQRLADRRGSFRSNEFNPEKLLPEQDNKEFRMGPMGPDSPEMNSSLRYFTIAFSENGETVKTVAFNIAAVTETEAQEWAVSLLKENTGWTRGTYRYRVYKDHEMTYVTIIDQGRELLPSFRILLISAVGEVLVLVISWLLLLGIGRKVYAPIEEADRKQKTFINNVNREFSLPLTIISGNTELTERKYGPDDQTRSTRRQITKLNELVDKLGSFGLLDEDKSVKLTVPISEFISATVDKEKERFSSKGTELVTDIDPEITVSADPESINRMMNEIMENLYKYSVSKAFLSLKKENEVVLIQTENDTTLSDGPVEQVFDRFTKLENAKEDCAGLGLSYVKEIVKDHHGRVTAIVSNGMFILRITL